MFMRKLEIEESRIGIKTGERNINNPQNADEKILLSESEEGLKHLIKRNKQESKKVSLPLNIKKTKIMSTARKGNVKSNCLLADR